MDQKDNPLPIGDTNPQTIETTPVLPEDDYMTLLRLSSSINLFAKYEAASLTPSKDDAVQTLEQWNSAQPVLLQSLQTWKDGKQNFFRTNTPYFTLSSFLQTASELRSRGNTLFDSAIADASALLEQHIDDIGAVFEEKTDSFLIQNSNAGVSALQSLSAAAEYCSTPDARKKALGYIERAVPSIIPQIRPNAEGRYQFANFLHPLFQVLSHGSDPAKSQVKELVLAMLQSDSGEDIVNTFTPTSEISRSYLKSYEDDVFSAIQSHLNRYDIDSGSMMSQWRSSDKMATDRAKQKWSFRARTIPEALKTLSALESHHPDVAKTLQEEFGLSNFFWYPSDMLIRQYEERGNHDKPYGVVWAPKIDEQNWVSGSMPAIHDLYANTNEDVSIRFMEAKRKDGPSGIGKRLDDFHERYYAGGEGHKISFMIMLGHSFLSATDTIHFGDEWNEGGYLRTSDLRKPTVQKYVDYFTPNPSLILASCKVKDTFGVVIKDLFGVDLQASEELVNCITSITPNVEDDDVHLDASFTRYYLSQEAFDQG